MWDAIVLHTAFGIAERKAPEVALVNYGINMDVGEVVEPMCSPPTKSTGWSRTTHVSGSRRSSATSSWIMPTQARLPSLPGRVGGNGARPEHLRV